MCLMPFFLYLRHLNSPDINDTALFDTMTYGSSYVAKADHTESMTLFVAVEI